jgi:hypothetical protein
MSFASAGRIRGMSEKHEPSSDLPAGLASPARRALAQAGYTRLDQLARVGEAELLGLHGMGPKALDQLRRALAARGLAFADGGPR